MKMYFDKSVSWENLQQLKSGLTKDMARFDAKKTREKFLAVSSYQTERLLPYSIRPFETRWCYFSEIRPLWNEPRPTLWQHFGGDNLFLLTRFSASKTPEGVPFFSTKHLSDDHFFSPDAVAISLRLRVVEKKKNEHQTSLFGETKEETRASLSEFARKYLQSLGFTEIDKDAETASLIWYHALAIGYATEYLSENADGIRQDFPRIPLPNAKEDLITSANLGKRIAELLDTEKQVTGVTVGKIDECLRTVGVASHAEGKQFCDEDFALTAGWGHAGKDGVTMPAKGKYNIREAEITGLGETTYDIFINDFAYWQNVPEKVWQYYIGGYQVIKKWLSYREIELLGRPLTLDEIAEVTNMIRRISAIILLEDDLNENYRKIKIDFYKE
jgi:Type ISP C-terminal specificity domain